MTEPTTAPQHLEITVTLNGEAASLPSPTVQAALARAGLRADTGHIAIAVNETVVARTQWPTTVLHDGDNVEIITAVAGG